MMDRFRPYCIKADRSFLGSRGEGHTLEALVAMERPLQTKLIVEGTETKEDREYLCDIGVRYAQGFNLGVPSFISEKQVAGG